MTAFERREQLIRVGRKLFAERDMETLSVEEIAAAAKVSKPIIYEHFGGKEGLYAVVVDRELKTMSDALEDFFAHPPLSERHTMELGVLTFLTYVEEHNEGFHVLLRDSPTTNPNGSLNTLLTTVSVHVEKMLDESFKRAKLPTKGAPYYANMIVGLTVFSAELWADNPRISKEELASYIVNMAWYGMRGIDAKPQLYFEGKEAKARQEREAREEEKQLKREARREQKEAKARAKRGDDDDNGDDGDDTHVNDGEREGGERPYDGPDDSRNDSASADRADAGTDADDVTIDPDVEQALDDLE